MIAEVKPKSMSKDRLRDFHSERTRFLGDKRGYMNAYQSVVSKTSSKKLILFITRH